MAKKRALGTLQYQRVYRELRGRILSGHYEPGAQIETEPELTKQLGVSIITIRQAEGMLEEDGLLDRQQGRGTFIPESVRGRLKVLGVIGLSLTQGLKNRMGSYHTDLVLLSEQEAARLGMEFEAVWLDAHDSQRVTPYLEEAALHEFWGFVFIGCGPRHPLLERVRKLGLRYVVISPHAPEERRRVWLDFREAIRLALGVFDNGAAAPPLVIGIDNLRQDMEAVLREKGRQVPQVYFPGLYEGSYDTAGYVRALELHREGTDLSRVLLLDDIVAQGVTRALLKLGFGERPLTLAVICGRQEMIPLGLPVTYVVHDTAEEVRQAFHILQAPPSSRADAAVAWRSGFRVFTEA